MIRHATKDDYLVIEEMAKSFFELAYFGVPYKAGSALFYMDMALEQNLLLVAELNGEVVGFAGGLLFPLIGNNDYMNGSEMAWWVEPEYRGGRLGIQLMQALEKAAKEAGCTFWHMVFMETSMPEEVEKIYQKMGYKNRETSYGKRL